jgi:ribokinase
MTAGKIVVVGSSNTDMVVKAPRLPGPGETVLSDSFAELPGGKGANQAVAAARLGAAVTFVGCVGQDALGARALEGLQREGIDTRFVVRDPQAPSGVALIVVDPSGENLIAVAPGANGLLSAEAVERAAPAFDDADIVLLQLEVPLEAVARAIELVRRRNRPIILDPAPAQPVPDEILSRVDIITPNVHEARTLAEERNNRPRPRPRKVLDPEPTAHREVVEFEDEDEDDSERRTRNAAPPTPEALAEALLIRGAPCVMVTLGSEGVLVARAGEARRLPARAVEAVDSTAAGDAFAGALATALSEGAGLNAATEFAVAAAALSVTRLGAQPSLARREEVERLLRGGS